MHPCLSHWGRVTHICVSKLTIIGSDNGLSPGRRQAIIWTNDGILLIGPLGTNFSDILIEIYKFSFKKMHLKMSSGKWRPICLGLNVLKTGLNLVIILPTGAAMTSTSIVLTSKSMTTSSDRNNFRVTGPLCAGKSPVPFEFPSQRPATRRFDVVFDLRLNKRLRKHLRRRWFETPLGSLWRHCDAEENKYREMKIMLNTYSLIRSFFFHMAIHIYSYQNFTLMG